MSYRQQETAVFLQCAHKSQEGHAGDDDATDQQNVGKVQAGQGWGEGSHLEIHRQVHTQAQDGSATHLTGRDTRRQIHTTDLLIIRNLLKGTLFQWWTHPTSMARQHRAARAFMTWAYIGHVTDVTTPEQCGHSTGQISM
ncbi:hypothetical protein INR49_005234 [Caranx melampygus]|nr:hypothetical protein INR49_005234 [Caranx melampygus]